MEAWVSLIERVGFPIFVCLLLIWMIRNGVRWYGVKVLEPKAKADVALLDSVRDTNNRHAESQAKLVEAQLMQSTLLTKLARGQEVQTELLRDLAGKHLECPVRKT